MGKVVVRGEAARQQVIDILKNGGSLDEAAEKTGFGRNYCRQLGAKAGIRPKPYKKCDDKKIVCMVDGGMCLEDMAKFFGCDVSTVRIHCNRLGIKPQKKLTKKQSAIKRLREQGKCCTEIADITGVPNSEVRRIAIAIGMPFTDEEKKRSVKIGLEKAYENQYGNHLKTAKECKWCGKTFHGTKWQKYCSINCQDRAKNSSHARAIKKAKIIDNTITLDKLYRRDKGICWICGEACDYEDNRVNERGFFIAGNMYPSIDHVYPLSKGGNHTWGNVKLAHRYCNSLKRDKVVC